MASGTSSADQAAEEVVESQLCEKEDLERRKELGKELGKHFNASSVTLENRYHALQHFRKGSERLKELKQQLADVSKHDKEAVDEMKKCVGKLKGGYLHDQVNTDDEKTLLELRKEVNEFLGSFLQLLESHYVRGGVGSFLHS